MCAYDYNIIDIFLFFFFFCPTLNPVWLTFTHRIIKRNLNIFGRATKWGGGAKTLPLAAPLEFLINHPFEMKAELRHLANRSMIRVALLPLQIGRWQQTLASVSSNRRWIRRVGSPRKSEPAPRWGCCTAGPPVDRRGPVRHGFRWNLDCPHIWKHEMQRL